MRQPDLNRLALFAAVVEAGGFTAAADKLGMAKSQLSQQVARLEAELGVALLTRTTRRVGVTEAGERLHTDCAPLLAGLHEAVSRLGQEGTLSGRLRITAGSAYSEGVLGGLLVQFARLHPALELELVASDTPLDLVAEGMDLAIRAGILRDSSLHAVKLGDFAQVAVATPGLFAQMGCPRTPAALNGQPWVALSVLPSPLTWGFRHGEGGAAETVRGRAVMRMNSASLVRECVRADVGCGVLPDYMLHEDLATGRLIHLLPDWQLPAAGIYAVYPAARYLPAKVRALIDYLRLHLPSRVDV
ncbi:LysR family transcriptional regulator [Chitinimonas sp. BJYL2]|uniref:LysR family transcriptional regulator n=1 Tax=Chitinimonas sp. BJYL2 TaxID=2976696 RepID=UPI0022B351A4|nr:LysR family transcriptional regulator [Chitinimonas sp. BJYL2]